VSSYEFLKMAVFGVKQLTARVFLSLNFNFAAQHNNVAQQEFVASPGHNIIGRLKVGGGELKPDPLAQ